jgi:hypothetical protein
MVQGAEQCDPGNGMSSMPMMSMNNANGCTSANSTCDMNCRAAPVR